MSRRRPRRTFQRRKRRYWVRRKKFFNFKKKKLSKLRLIQFQPAHIKKCRIKGFLQLFGAGHGRFSNDFTMYKESTVLPHEPGGGGWCLQQITLNSLYVQNSMLMNWWTRSNKGLNMCRFLGSKLTLYREENVDYIFTYDIEPPYDVTKYYFASLHPYKLLIYNKRVIVPSMRTQPNRKKKYITKRIRPPKDMMNKWYFQQTFSRFPLIQFAAVACSLDSMFMSKTAINNNVSLHTINTAFFQNSCFHISSLQQTTWGYTPKPNTYIYGIQQAQLTVLETKIKNVTYLGNTNINDPGDEIGTHTKEDYGLPHWGNPFYYSYLNGDMPTFITTIDPEQMIQKATGDAKLNTIKDQITFKQEPYILECRYNPYHDTGYGNEAYWIPNNVLTRQTWDPLPDPILKIEGFPLWILLWGWEDFTKNQKNISNIDNNYLLVVRTKWLDVKQQQYVFLSPTYIHGQAPYDDGRENMSINDLSNWYPKFRYQKEAIENLLMSGPGVCKAENVKSISAYLKYNLSFKWGGNPAPMESIADPTQQPTYPIPNTFNISNEITDPNTPIENFIYKWDTRRDMLTQKATERITSLDLHEPIIFTDGETTAETSKTKTTPQETSTKEKEKESLQLQLQYQQQYNRILWDRIQQLNKLITQ